MSSSPNKDQKIQHHFGLTLGSYAELLEIAAKKFRAITFDAEALYEGEILWRHDVDFSLLSALKLAELDAQFGFQSTFFLRFRAETYNLFESRNLRIVEEIRRFGHDIGLHFEPSEQDLESETHLAEALERDKHQLLTGGVAGPIKSFSFHNTTPKSLQYKSLEYAGMKNAYASEFMLPDKYVSDSGGYWRFTPMKDFLENPALDRAQVLTHPEWWLQKDMPPLSKIAKAAEEQASQAMSKYQDDLTRFGLPLNKGTLEELEKYAQEEHLKIPMEMVFLFQQQNFEVLLAWLLCEISTTTLDPAAVAVFVSDEFSAMGYPTEVTSSFMRCSRSENLLSDLYRFLRDSEPNVQDMTCLILGKRLIKLTN